ncbi:hypothetical protein [Mesorhizobium sp. CN2-181]|uniref:hypothetical protein n=1 Tax=Mesorhizobium yinganensis TaxID=3157707 RepID=UPI0032B7C620
MEPVAQSLWRLEFARKAAVTRELEERLRDDKQLKDRREKDKSEDQREDGELAAIAEVLASNTEIADFGVKLDTYDAATVDALMANDVDLQAVRDRIEDMMLEAHTLPDGRRVFKTRDGTKVFDENGAELKPEEVDPLEIDNRKPRWEDLLDAKREEAELVDERRDLIEFQEKLDGARERLDDPALTKDELDALDKELGDAMPERVKATLDRDNDRPKPEAEAAIDVELRAVPRGASLPTGPAGP